MINNCKRLTFRDFMLTQMFIFNSLSVIYNLRYVSVIILCTELGMITVSEIN